MNLFVTGLVFVLLLLQPLGQLLLSEFLDMPSIFLAS